MLDPEYGITGILKSYIKNNNSITITVKTTNGDISPSKQCREGLNEDIEDIQDLEIRLNGLIGEKITTVIEPWNPDDPEITFYDILYA